MEKKGKILSFQGIRGLAILLVFLSHCENLLNVDGVNRLSYLGGAGVSLFICLSGFLAAYKYQDRRELPGAFRLYISKWKKFYKLHFLTLFFAVPFTFELLREALGKWLIILGANISLLQILVPWKGIYFSFNAVSWYLSLTLIFAILTPFTIRMLKRINKVILMVIIAGIILFEFLFCFILKGSSYQHWLVYICPFVRWLDFFAGGGKLIFYAGRFSVRRYKSSGNGMA